MKKKKWTAEDVERLQVIAQDTISLNVIISSPEDKLDCELGEVIEDMAPGPDEIVMDRNRFDLFSKLLKELRPREQHVLELRYGFRTGTYMTLEEVGKVYGITRERVRQIEHKALKSLRGKLKEMDLKEGDI